MILIALLLLSASRAQSQSQTSPPLSFEVASVKEVEQPWLEIAPKRVGGRITWTTDLWFLIGYAYSLPRYRISGPIPGSDHIYQFEAKTSADTTDDQVRLMFQSLLAERFKMTAHRVTKDGDGYLLSIGKGGLKIKEVKPGDPPPPMPEWFSKVAPAQLEGKVVSTAPQTGIVAITARRVAMSKVSDALGRLLQTPVLDETGLKGEYYFALRYAREDAPADVDALPLFETVQRDLGLKLERHKGPIEVLVVDRIERIPTGN
jgi:uncharacterized protein (TIGR03435 family)